MIDLVLLGTIFLAVSALLIFVSLVLVAYVQIGDFHLAVAATILTLRSINYTKKKETIDRFRLEVTELIYDQLQVIMNKTDEELKNKNNINIDKVNELRKEINEILNSNPKYLITEKQMIILLKASDSYSFFASFKKTVDIAESLHIESRKSFAKDLKKEQLKAIKLDLLYADLPKEKDLVKSLLV